MEEQEPKELLYLGFSAYDLMRAGFNETELLGAGVADAEILRAREDIKAEQLKRGLASGSVVRRALSRGISRAESKVAPGDSKGPQAGAMRPRVQSSPGGLSSYKP